MNELLKSRSVSRGVHISWPILALREGARERTGLILATQGAEIRRIDAVAETEAPAFDTDLAQESRLIALDALPDRPVDRSQMLMLGGSMQPCSGATCTMPARRPSPKRPRRRSG